MTLRHWRISCAMAAAAIFALMPAVPQLAAAPAANQSPVDYCRTVGNDDALRKPPASLAEALHSLFKVSGPEALQSSYYRCMGGAVMLCNVGANIPCGKANTSTNLPGAREWCRKNPNSDFIPMAATGHDTIYEWSCKDGKPVTRKFHNVDDRGFVADAWMKLP
jgi:hypothetical protein